MQKNTRAAVRACVALCAALLVAAQARAQRVDAVGVRARGMGGAFVAVADDATASWWNPAGVAAGPYFTALLEPVVESANRADPSGLHPVALAAAFPALAVSYYRVPFFGRRTGAPASSIATGRGDERNLNLLGITVGQSVGDHLVVASTVKLVHALEQTRGDLDVGVMASAGPMRVGLSLKNLSSPGFTDTGGGVTIPRQARAGIAFVSGPPGAALATIALDVDLTRTPTPAGDERRVASGFEVWAPSRRFGVRAGLSANTVDDARVSASAGASAAIRSGLYVDFQGTSAGDDLGTSWGCGLRVTF